MNVLHDVGSSTPRRRAAWLVAAACGAVALAGPSRAAEPVLIGEYGSLTGGTATFGQSTHKGIELAVEETNAAGGVLGGRKVVLVTEDDQSKPEEAKTAMLKLLKQHKVVATLGEVASSRSLAAAPEAQRAKVPMISPSSTNPAVTQVGDYIFRICFIDPFQGETMARFARENLKASTAAILRDVKNDYSVGLADFFVRTFEAAGGKIVADESYSEGDIEFRAQLTTLRGKKPDVIFIPGYYTEVGLIARQARELGLRAKLLGGDGWDSEKTVEIGGDAVNGAFFSNHYAMDDPSPTGKAFAETFRAKYGETPDAMAVLGYDAAKLLIDAIGRAGSSDPTKIRDAIAATKDFPGVSGAITIDENRNAKKRIVILEIVDGKFQFETAIAPAP